MWLRQLWFKPQSGSSSMLVLTCWRTETFLYSFSITWVTTIGPHITLMISQISKQLIHQLKQALIRFNSQQLIRSVKKKLLPSVIRVDVLSIFGHWDRRWRNHLSVRQALRCLLRLCVQFTVWLPVHVSRNGRPYRQRMSFSVEDIVV